MRANYHTHTWRCGHATGTEREYVEAAISRELQTLGFSDHTPYPFPWYYHSFIRMGCNQLQDYADTILKLRDEFRDTIQIRLGVEAEYYPKYFPQLRSMLSDQGIEYMILGQHYLDNEMMAHYAGRATSSEKHLEQYCAQSRDAMQTGLFSYFAHPDLIRFTGDEAVYSRHMRALCKEARDCRIPLEVNLLGFETGRHYPNRCFWEIAAEEGCQVILGCDAHNPNSLKDQTPEDRALQMIRELGLDLLHDLTLRPII
jgi:histidinol-phosphatase (PHP family)